MTEGHDRERGIALIRDAIPVSHETVARLDVFVDLLRDWQRVKNLIGASTLTTVWTRHIADSAQVLAAAPAARHWVDLGAGAGFPGLVVAILLADIDDAMVHLVESNGRKCAFLRTAIRATAASALVSCRRAEDFIETFSGPCDVVTARALAPLGRLLPLAAPLIARGAVGIFHKGQDVEAELTEASRYWSIDADPVPSRTDPDGRLLIVRSCGEKFAQAQGGRPYV